MWEVVALSVRVALACLLVVVPVGTALAWVLSRYTFRGRVVVDALVHAPLVVPPVVTGYVLLLLFGRASWFGGWLESSLGVRVAFTTTAAVIAAAVTSLPLYVRAVRLSFDRIDPRLEDAARGLGAGPAASWWRVSLPLAAPGVITGAVLAFARSLGEFGATITFAGNLPGETRTMALAIHTALQTPNGDALAWQIAALSIVVSLGAVIAGELMLRRGRR